MKNSLIVTGLCLMLSASAYAYYSCPNDKFMMEKAEIFALKNNSVIEFNGTPWMVQLSGSLPEKIVAIQRNFGSKDSCEYVVISETERSVTFKLHRN